MLNKLKFIAIPLLATSLFLTGCMSEEYVKEQQEFEKVSKQMETSYLPEGYTIYDIIISDDKSVIQIITNNYYVSENIPNLISHLNSLKTDETIKDFDVHTYQNGTKYADDQIVIIIFK